jgi:hypothetical protein
MGDGHGDVPAQGSGEWISLGDTARRLGVTRASVYGRIKRGTLQTRPKATEAWRCFGPLRDIATTVMATVAATVGLTVTAT